MVKIIFQKNVQKFLQRELYPGKVVCVLLINSHYTFLWVFILAIVFIYSCRLLVKDRIMLPLTPNYVIIFISTRDKKTKYDIPLSSVYGIIRFMS